MTNEQQEQWIKTTAIELFDDWSCGWHGVDKGMIEAIIAVLRCAIEQQQPTDKKENVMSKELSYDRYYVRPDLQMGTGFRDQIIQLLRITWDGDLVSKSGRDELVKKGLAVRTNGGYNILTKEGIEYLHNNNYLQS
jgi:hypothetical protein